MSMEDNSNKGNKLSDQEIISYPNFNSTNSMASFLSAVPKKMDMEMTMLEASSIVISISIFFGTADKNDAIEFVLLKFG